MIQYISLDVEALDPMTGDRKVDGFQSDMLLIGGQGGVVYNNFRFGGFGFGNSQDTAGRAGGERRSADMSFGGGGIFMEWTYPVGPGLAVVGGSLIGAGSMSLSASGDDLGPSEDWSADGSFFMAYPYAGVIYAPVKFAWIQLDAGYLLFEMDTGGSKFENDLDLDMVDGDITGGFSASLKIHFGFDPSL